MHKKSEISMVLITRFTGQFFSVFNVIRQVFSSRGRDHPITALTNQSCYHQFLLCHYLPSYCFSEGSLPETGLDPENIRYWCKTHKFCIDLCNNFVNLFIYPLLHNIFATSLSDKPQVFVCWLLREQEEDKELLAENEEIKIISCSLKTSFQLSE